MKVVGAGEFARATAVMRGGWRVPDNVTASVASILAAVRERGDAALVEYERRYDDERYDISKLRVAIPMASSARSLVAAAVADALDRLRERVARYHERQRRADLSYAEADGTKYGLCFRPLDAVAVYAPSASAALMGVVPAKLAGVGRTLVLAPPQPGGHVHPAVLYACAVCEVDELYALGGAQAIAAAAFGTDSIEPVDKVVGPGGMWVTEAKRQIFGRCGVEALAGPPELLIVADDGASSELIVGEMLSVAELDARACVAIVSESRSLLDAVAQLIDTLGVGTLAGAERIAEVLGRNAHLVHARKRGDVFETIERFAPGYLCLHVRDPDAYLPRIRRAGAVFVGNATPLACGTYLAGTNGVVPTAGTARFSSALSLGDFMRSFTVVENSAERTAADAGAIALLAELEGRPQHALAVRMRSGEA
ncbi:MAG TPA: histidinol dehydrogenase [Verrucomicrobiae bacterium]|nr:histidinol dehydrogenase [Verrucomicrobiae bacterium]